MRWRGSFISVARAVKCRSEKKAMSREKQFAKCIFLTEFDATLIQEKLQQCHPETTIAIIVSKTFTTQETMTIFETVREWFVNAAGSAEKIKENRKSFFGSLFLVASNKAGQIVA